MSLTFEPLHILSCRPGRTLLSVVHRFPSETRSRQTVKLTPASSEPRRTPSEPTCKSLIHRNGTRPPAYLFRYQVVKQRGEKPQRGKSSRVAHLPLREPARPCPYCPSRNQPRLRSNPGLATPSSLPQQPPRCPPKRRRPVGGALSTSPHKPTQPPANTKCESFWMRR